MSMKTENTADKIISSTVDLMSDKGYKAVTIKEIAAAASVSEMTVFRTFGSKKAILDAIIDNYLFSAPIEQIIQKNITYELETDLLMISNLYHDVLKRNKKIYLISIMERKTMPEIHLSVHNNALKFLKIVTEYLHVMQQKGKVVKGNPEAQALTIMRYNYGKFVAGTLLEGTSSAVGDDDMEEAISIIARGLKT
ncbi:AcrR family transcriptional regulator [Bacillus horti]|uniref:AcrR family transcriptional regulator n=2 Tax=Caldalkalibacillus horti TaxID=77523 RepID=A0ABT9VYS6_9BACI|nr:AcrR family transcriptional regulator [Bacillus horti]